MLHPPITLETLDNLGQMKIEIAYPPNIDAIDKVFPGVKRDCTRRGIFFAYGPVIYNPSGHVLPIELVAHECVHSIQQDRIGVESWWNQYLDYTPFRFEQELEAHRVEYRQYIADHPGRNFRRRYAAAVAERLSGPLYGRMLKKDAAKQAILEDEPCE